MATPQSSLDQESAQRRLVDLTVLGVRNIWQSMFGRNWQRAWEDGAGPAIDQIIAAGQEAAAAQSSLYVGEVLRELDVPDVVPTEFLADNFSGVTGGGYPTIDATYSAVTTAVKAQYRPDLAELGNVQRERAALAEAEDKIAAIAATIMADTARAAETAAIAERPWVTGYIRMIEPGACSRCAVLAGKFYLFNSGFERHPQCRCIHIPAMEDIPHDARTNPNAYFDSLSAAEQDQVFTIAGAEAIRLGADISQVVNARRGMSTAQQNPRGWISKGRLIPVDVYGEPLRITTEGVTRRGVGRKAMGSGRPVRLMPESIVQLAKTPEERVRLLKLYGYIR